MSQSRTVASRPPVTSKFRSGCSAIENTPLRCPWNWRTTLFCSKSQHFICLSSPHENKYGWRSDMTIPVTVLICPVNVTFSYPVTRSQNLIVRSLDPDTKNLFMGSTAKHLTQPTCPLITVFSFHGACHFGSLNLRYLNAIAFECTASACTRLFES